MVCAEALLQNTMIVGTLLFVLTATTTLSAPGKLRVCEPGDSYDDYCNKCWCAEDGLGYTCTQDECAEYENGCVPGYQYDDGCSVCSCVKDGTNLYFTCQPITCVTEEYLDYEVTVVTDPVTLGEGPHWDHDRQVLYFVDITGSTVSKYVPATNKLTRVKIEGGTVSLVIPVEGSEDKFVITVGSKVAILTWDGESTTPADVEYVSNLGTGKESQDFRLNDGKADPTGRFWSGTYGPEGGALYSFSKDWKATEQLTNVKLSNGMAWTEDKTTMYYIDSFNRTVQAFDYDAENGTISNQRIAFNFKYYNIEGMPDGMAIDTEGNLWIACFGGSQVIHVNPSYLSGEVKAHIDIPAPQVTSVAFGGPLLDELYVTTANLSEEYFKEYPLSGSTFRVTNIRAKGYPGQPVKL